MKATVFIVGKNQAKTFPESRLNHDRHMDGLFNRSGETARGIYDEMTGGGTSPIRLVHRGPQSRPFGELWLRFRCPSPWRLRTEDRYSFLPW